MCDVKYYVFQCLKDEKGEHENGVDLGTLFLLNYKELRKREIVNKYIKPELIHRPAFLFYM